MQRPSEVQISRLAATSFGQRAQPEVKVLGPHGGEERDHEVQGEAAGRGRAVGPCQPRCRRSACRRLNVLMDKGPIARARGDRTVNHDGVRRAREQV